MTDLLTLIYAFALWPFRPEMATKIFETLDRGSGR